MNEILGAVKDNFTADMKRVYVTGVGRGGHGAWGLAARMPEYFAATVPIRGQRIGIKDYATLVKMPIWVGHSIEDEEVSYGESSVAVNKIEALMDDQFLMVENLDASQTAFLDHDKAFTSLEGEDWPNLYTGPELYQWLLKHELKATAWD